MLDLAGIVFSSVMMMIVLLRVIRLDGSIPWFSVSPKEEEAKLTGQLNRSRFRGPRIMDDRHGPEGKGVRR